MPLPLVKSLRWPTGGAGCSFGEEKRAERILWPKEVPIRVHTLSYPDARYSNSILNVRGSNEGSEGFVRRINTGINVMGDILPSPPPSACPYLQEILLSTNLVPPFIGRIPRIIAGDKQTALLTGYRGNGSDNNERFMKLMVRSMEKHF